MEELARRSENRCAELEEIVRRVRCMCGLVSKDQLLPLISSAQSSTTVGTVVVNSHQCEKVAKRLGQVCETLVRLPDPLPSVSLMATVRSAEMILNEMTAVPRTTSGKTIPSWVFFVRRYNTGSCIFLALKRRMRRVWSLHSTTSWEAEDATAAQLDEVHNMNVAKSQSNRDPDESPIFFEAHLSPDESTPSCSQVVATHIQLGLQNRWKIPFESLTFNSRKPRYPLRQLDGKYCPRFEPFGGMMIDGIAVVVKELATEYVSPETLEAFVIDSSTRWKWFHPNIARHYGSFAEKFENDRPYLSLGSVVEDTSCTTSGKTFEPLSNLLFVQGIKFTLHEALGIVEQLLEAVEYMMLDTDDVPNEVITSWCTFSPTNIFLEKESIEPRLLFSPPLCILNGPVNRYSPHTQALCAVSYGICQLMMTILTATQPYAKKIAQADLRETLLQTSERGFDNIRCHFPPEFRRVIEQGMSVKGKPMTRINLRKHLSELHEVADRYPPHQTIPVPPFTVEDAVDDYGEV